MWGRLGVTDGEIEMEVIDYEDFIKTAKQRFGEKSVDWKFVCPRCKTEQSARDLHELAGLPKKDVEKYIGFSCIGRFNGAMGCNWTLGGLFSIHEVEVAKDGKNYPRFALAKGE